MPEEIEKINDIFRLHEEIEKTASQKKIDEEVFIRGIGRSTDIRIAKLANDAGIIGAANLK